MLWNWTHCIATVCMFEWGTIHIASGCMVLNNRSYRQLLLCLHRSHNDPPSKSKMTKGDILAYHGLNPMVIGLFCVIFAVLFLFDVNRYAWHILSWPFGCDVMRLLKMELPGIGSSIAAAQRTILCVGLLATSTEVIRKYDDQITQSERALNVLIPLLAIVVEIITMVQAFCRYSLTSIVGTVWDWLQKHVRLYWTIVFR